MKPEEFEPPIQRMGYFVECTNSRRTSNTVRIRNLFVKAGRGAEGNQARVQGRNDNNLPPAPKPLFAGEIEEVIANAELIRESIADQSWEMIETLASVWSEEFKSAVWKQLTLEERSAVKQLKPQFNT